jgi:hypothetical protein
MVLGFEKNIYKSLNSCQILAMLEKSSTPLDFCSLFAPHLFDEICDLTLFLFDLIIRSDARLQPSLETKIAGMNRLPVDASLVINGILSWSAISLFAHQELDRMLMRGRKLFSTTILFSSWSEVLGINIYFVIMHRYPTTYLV